MFTKFSSALFIDTKNRDLKVSVVSVTQVPDRGLVIRFGGEVGSLTQLVADGEFNVGDMPILLADKGYGARSSAGFVGVKSSRYCHRATSVIGVQGMPWQKNPGLTLLGEPISVHVLQPGTRIKRVATHAAGKRAHSNTAAASAAHAAIELRANLFPQDVFVLEGQSDYCQAFSLVGPENGVEKFTPEWPEEHRLDRFSDEAIAEKVSYRFARHYDEQSGGFSLNEAKQMYFLAVMAASCPRETGDEWNSQSQDWVNKFAQKILGTDWLRYWESVQQAAQAVLERKLQEGWKLNLVPEKGRVKVLISSPEGEETEYGFNLGEGGFSPIPYQFESQLLKLTSNSQEEKTAYASTRRAEMLFEYLKKPIRDNPSKWDITRYQLLHGAAKYRLMPVRNIGDWKYSPQGESLIADSIEGLFTNPAAADLVNKQPILFLVSYDQEGTPTAAQHCEWGFAWYGWNGVATSLDMLKDIPLA